IPSPVAGTVQEFLVEQDDTVEVGADLAVIGEGDATASSDDSSSETSAEESREEPQAEEAQEEAPPEEPQEESRPEPEPAPAAESESSGSSGGGEGTTVEMPALGESVSEGTISRWLK